METRTEKKAKGYTDKQYMVFPDLIGTINCTNIRVNKKGSDLKAKIQYKIIIKLITNCERNSNRVWSHEIRAASLFILVGLVEIKKDIDTNKATSTWLKFTLLE